MTSFFKNLSIQRKLTSIIMLTSCIALILACAAFVTNDLLTFRRNLVSQMSTLADQSTLTTVVMGDFNDWMWPGSVQNILATKLPARTPHRSFPARFPLLKLDRIYCRPAPALLSSRVDRTAGEISDHLPIIAEIRPDLRESSEHPNEGGVL